MMSSKSSAKPVWLVIDSLTYGGIETHVLQLATGLIRNHVPVRVLLVRRYGSVSPLEQKLRDIGVDVDFLSDSGQSPLFALIERVKQNAPQCLHCHGYKASLMGKVARLITGVRQLSTYHAGEVPSGKVWLYDALDRYSAFMSHHTLCVSDAIRARIPFRSKLQNNFIDTQGLAASVGHQIAYVGRLSFEKAPDRFVGLAKALPNHHFDVYGTGPEEAKSRQPRLTNLTFHGHQAEMNQIWPDIGVLVIPSRFEGLPMTALEAMARGIIVIAMDVGNLSRLIKHGKNGFLVSDPAQLPDTLCQVLALDNAQDQALRHSAVETIRRHYSLRAALPTLLKLYYGPHYQSDCQFENLN
ncbi:glycosyltransferase family 4 protein [Vibrio scophthalmi]|uniref:glycosyltransferase family 4 protein n=1 Tax=Vibrio scophthalmi TaxID=45658 RepID=UPI002FEEF49D